MKMSFNFRKHFYWLPGMRAFHAAGAKNCLKALGEFICIFIIGSVPLVLILLIEIFKSNLSISFPVFSKYIDAGQIFFYVSPIVGNIFYLVVIDFKKTAESSSKTSNDERFWFNTYLFIVSIASTLILVLYHTNLITNKEALVYSSLAIYAVSLYFNYLYVLYGYITNDYIASEGAASKEITDGLAGFNGEN